MNMIRMAEKGWIPDKAIRLGIRQLLAKREAQELAALPPLENYIQQLDASPIAVDTSAANDQHYELPPPYFQLALGPLLKYSCALYESENTSLAEAEIAMLELTCSRASLRDGDRILELGCGWGSLTLFMAEKFPGSRITAVSNSSGQRTHILAQASARRLSNVEVITADMNTFEPQGTFHRVVSVEMFEHMRNWRALFGRIHQWLIPGGTAFIHIFAHKTFRYIFETERDEDWMGRYFFTGGQMPSRDLLPAVCAPLLCTQEWAVNGVHYSRTLEDWLRLHDAQKSKVLEIFRSVYRDDAALWFQRWRLFYMACSELFAFRGGHEWFVMHYLLQKAP